MRDVIFSTKFQRDLKKCRDRGMIGLFGTAIFAPICFCCIKKNLGNCISCALAAIPNYSSDPAFSGLLTAAFSTSDIHYPMNASSGHIPHNHSAGTLHTVEVKGMAS